ncbi:TIGR03086 family metal-binding protein [Geodermatophilus poikilotrophus]|uniref:TIGR03086 family protein n=1 Tax=Geodermatophilus poikilotrophus TaxID=1333667 RepID=A0A1I0ASU8_9ACTN|nr:TIGR03086 family metal-binding protein [Geodermatophilus poikilotrophus]SES97252.1 TIGR03086 family protein [Geodermatophilus poikilotrophus]
MTAPRELYLRALDRLSTVVDAVPADCWDVPTPCPDWSARQLLGHLVDGQHQVLAMATGVGSRPPVTDSAALGALGGRAPAATWSEVRQQITRALAGIAPSTSVATPLGSQTVGQLLGIALIEPVVHAWDLATATGQAADLDPDAVRALLPGVLALGDRLQATGMYRAAVRVPGQAPPQDQLLAAVGRNPNPSSTHDPAT